MQYEPASWSTPLAGCRPGSLALGAAVKALWPSLRVLETGPDAVYGCYNPRPITGNPKLPSLHREGRALDLGIGWDSTLVERAQLHACTRMLATACEALGVQLIIYNRQTFRGYEPMRGWLNQYSGGTHVDHAHVELTWNAARTLTLPAALAILDRRPLPGDDDMPVFVKDASNPNRVLERLPGGAYVDVDDQDVYDVLGVDHTALPVKVIAPWMVVDRTSLHLPPRQ